MLLFSVFCVFLFFLIHYTCTFTHNIHSNTFIDHHSLWSVTCWYGSGSATLLLFPPKDKSVYRILTDPDPTIFFIDKIMPYATKRLRGTILTTYRIFFLSAGWWHEWIGRKFSWPSRYTICRREILVKYSCCQGCRSVGIHFMITIAVFWIRIVLIRIDI